MHNASFQILHATCVEYRSCGVLILGRSGQGKSALALQLMAYGAILVSDDQTQVAARDGCLRATVPTPIQGMIEARGIGLLNAEHSDESTIQLIVDLDHAETLRFPEFRTAEVCGVVLPCLYHFDAPHFPAGVLQYLKAGRRMPND